MGIVGLQQKIFQVDEKLALAAELPVHFKFNCQKVEKFQTAQPRIRHFGNNRRHINHSNQAVYQGGFAGADITSQKQKSLIFQYSVLQGCQRFGVLFTEPKKLWVGGNLKRHCF